MNLRFKIYERIFQFLNEHEKHPDGLVLLSIRHIPKNYLIVGEKLDNSTKIESVGPL